MTAPPFAPDAELLGEQAARRLLEQASRYVREALAFPEEIDVLRTVAARAVLEVAMLREQVERLAGQVERLEQRSGGGR